MLYFVCFYYVHSLQDTEATRAAFWAANPNSYEVNGVVMSPETYYQTAIVQENRQRWVWIALYKEVVFELECVRAKINGIKMLLGRARAKRMLREIPHLIADNAAADQAAANPASSNLCLCCGGNRNLQQCPDADELYDAAFPTPAAPRLTRDTCQDNIKQAFRSHTNYDNSDNTHVRLAGKKTHIMPPGPGPLW